MSVILEPHEEDVLKEITGFEKSAILLLSLSEERAAYLLGQLEPRQVQKLGMAMAGVEPLPFIKIFYNLFRVTPQLELIANHLFGTP